MRTTLPLPPEVVSDVASDVATSGSAASTVGVSTAHAGGVGDERMARVHRRIARVLLGGLALQLFFAGLGVFGITSFLPHVILGTIVVLSSFALPIVAWRGHLSDSIRRRSWCLAGLMLLQGLLIDAGRVVPIVSALHPVNAMLLVLVTYSLIEYNGVHRDTTIQAGEVH